MIEYILGLLVVNSLLLLWFFSPLKITLGEIFFKKTLMPDQFDDLLFIKNKILGKLLSCHICLSFWLSLFVGAVFAVLFVLPWFWPLMTFFTYPGICYLYLKIIKQ